MATRSWIFIINTFYSNTRNSMKKALTLTNDHVARLTANEADPEILDIKNDYLPLHTGFLTAQHQLDSKLGFYHGQTQTFEELLEELAKTKINEWRGTVFNIFPEGTPDARAIFPRDREPFQADTYDQRVEAVETLSITLATYISKPTLVTLSAAVHTYHLTLTGARALQQTDEGSVATLRSNLKAAHIIMCDGLYRNLGLLMAKFSTTRSRVADFFDLTLLRSTAAEDEPFITNGSLAAGNIFGLAGILEDVPFEITPDTVFRLKKTTPDAGSVTFYPANSPASPPGAGPQFPVSFGTTVEKTYTELGLTGMSDFNVQNTSPFTAGWEIEVIPEE